jgi:rod shape-determining protein MreD
MGYGLDLLAAAPVGLFTFVSVATFVLARAAGVRLAAQHIITQVPLAFVFSLVQSVMVLVLLAIFGANPHGAREMLSLVLPHAIGTALFSPIVFRIASKLHQTVGVPPRAERTPS